MLIGIFKKSTVLTPVILILVALFLWIDGFLYPGDNLIFFQDTTPLFQVLVPFILNYPLLQVIVAWVFLIFQALLLNFIVTSKGLSDRHTLLPALLYVVLMSSTFEMLSLHPVLFANFFLLLALNRIFDTFTEKEVAREVYNVGLLVAMAGLFYTPALLFFFLAIIALFVYLVGNIRGILATLLGFATPFFFLAVYYFLADMLDERLAEYLVAPRLFMVFSYPFSYFSQTFIIFLGVLFVISFLKVTFSHITDKPVRIRKRFNVLVWFFIIALSTTHTTTSFFEVHYALMLIPLSIFLSVFFLEMKKKRWAELIFTLLIVLIAIGKLSRLD